MSYETLERLERLRKLNSNKQWINHDLYRLMYREDLYILAYERIKSKPGNMTPGTDGEMLDGFSLHAIRQVIHEMKTEQFRFKPVRQRFIPKPNGKMRKLGIPMVRSYCPPYRVLSGLPCQRGSNPPTHAHSTVSYFAGADASFAISNVVELAYVTRR
jgi:hypothetical protein